ncbi:hypothetical protein ACVI1L_006113 [Bradyrhizobium sp. USDA 4516]
MRRSQLGTSIVSSTDQTIYLVADDFGAIGRARREADIVATDLDSADRLQHRRALVGRRIRRRRPRNPAPLRSAQTNVPTALRGFVVRHLDDRLQLPLRLV